MSERDGKDVFFHYDDMKLARGCESISKEALALMARDPNALMRFSFSKLAYIGRYGLSMKAVSLEFLGSFSTFHNRGIYFI